MRKVKTFFHIFINSLLPQATYYHKLARTPFSFSKKYFIALVYIVNSVFVVLLTIRLYGWGLFTLKDSLVSALKNYPRELTITVNNGLLQSNYERPYLFWITVNDSKKLVGVVDETATATQVKEYNSWVLFTSYETVMNPGDAIKKFPYGTRTLKVDKTSVEKIRSGVEKYFNIGLVGIFLFLLLIAPLIFVSLYFLYFFIVSMFVYLFFTLFSKKVKLAKTFQISLHAVTIPVIVDYGICLLKPEVAQFFTIHAVFFILSLIFVLSGVYEAYLDPITRTHHHN